MKKYEWVWPLSVLAFIFVAAGISRIDFSCGFERTTSSAAFVCRVPPKSVSGAHVVKGNVNEAGAQWMAKFDEDPVEFFTLVLAISTVLLWWDTNGLRRLGTRQSNDMRQSLEIAEKAANAAIAANQLNRDSFAVEYRPWVSVKVDVGTPLIWDVNGATATFRCALSNTGRTPAQGVWVHQRFAVHGGVNPDPKKMQLELIEAAIKNPHAIGITVFPNETYVMNVGLTIPHAEVAGFIDWIKAQGGQGGATIEHFPACLVGCVAYHSSFSEELHYTGFIYDVQKRDVPSARRLMLKQGENLNVNQVSIEDRSFLFKAAIAT